MKIPGISTGDVRSQLTTSPTGSRAAAIHQLSLRRCLANRVMATTCRICVTSSARHTKLHRGRIQAGIFAAARFNCELYLDTIMIKPPISTLMFAPSLPGAQCGTRTNGIRCRITRRRLQLWVPSLSPT